MSTDSNFKEFQGLALRTESKVENANMDVGSIKTLLRLFITVGTLLDYTKKGIFYNKYEKYDEHFTEIVGMMNDLVLTLAVAKDDRKEVSDLNFRTFHGLLGSLTESAEVAEILLKYLEHGTVDKVNVGEEYADGDWYKAIVFDELDLSETTTRANVINKLKVRYPEKYTDECAVNRDLSAEREKLEKDI